MAHTLAEYQEKINNAGQILVVYGSTGDFSAAAVAASLYLWLRHLEKRVSIVSPAAPTVELSHLVGINKVKNKLTGENLVIKLPLPASNIDKVVSDLDSEHDELSLVIKPKNSGASISRVTIPISWQAAEFDLVFLVDVRDTTELSSLTLGERDEFWHDQDKLVTFNTFANPSPLKANIAEVTGKNAGLASFWANFLFANQISIDADQASNLLMALERETSGFQPGRSGASDFELAAWLMRQGGSRFVRDEEAAENFRPENHLPREIDFKA